ncbi:MAG: hypothetical protein LIP08_02950 [Bacteroides sp.]|nr:hypothetical protein [Bacteroides sp.]
MDLNILLTIVTTFGGLEGVKWLVQYLANRKTNKRKEEADATGMEIANKQKQVDWLESRLLERDKKVDSLYIELRQEQEKTMQQTDQINKLNLALMEAGIKRCDIRGCDRRQPPSEY